MAVINKKEISKQDWKDFINWCDEGKFFFNNKNFLGELFSINKEFNIEKSLIEFFIYNKFILKDRYQLDLPVWLENKKGKTIEELIKELFNEFYKDKCWDILLDYYLKVIEYRRSDTTDNNIEFELSLEYNKFIKQVSELEPQTYNKWITYLNKNIYKSIKGIK